MFLRDAALRLGGCPPPPALFADWVLKATSDTCAERDRPNGDEEDTISNLPFIVGIAGDLAELTLEI